MSIEVLTKDLMVILPSRLTRVIFYVRRIGLYLYKYRIYGTIRIYILKGPAFVYLTSLALISVKIYSFE